MKKRLIIISLIFLLGLAAFFVVKAMNKEATALNDSFTKEFIAEEWVEDGFHLFESKTGQYTMLFPDQFQMISEPPEFYGRLGDSYEHWVGQILNDNSKGIAYSFKVTFKDEKADLTENQLHSMLNNHAYNDQYETINLINKTIYHGSSSLIFEGPKATIQDPNLNQANTFFGLISNEHSKKTVEIYYSLDCIEIERGCEINTQGEYEFALKVMKSVEFMDE
ncbi:hypothetical protein RYX56_17195 [Alkalihalophilus lindianensis]|uniref:Uncharacterized protein n=1 Tax=Alkalihalophilus lindianensis TaxID=1630542 RepID=A0ABU3XE03_9BACI|nr:hypothetical protein [Alkalihalophilus lindianensis]MDV2686107.1 hypothetical protein [Alkalihalophilus lindianensis]